LLSHIGPTLIKSYLFFNYHISRNIIKIEKRQDHLIDTSFQKAKLVNMSNKVDAVAHHEKSKINNELEALRKLHLAQNLRRKASANILENLSKNQMNTRQASGEKV